jgi:hypothetical protein
VPIVFWGAPVGYGAITPGSLPPAIPTTWANAYVYLNHSYTGFFMQDQWKIHPKLTLNYGLRWDFESGLEQVVNHDYRGFQPRVGFAYSPTKRTVIRSGYGIFDDHYNMTFFFVTYPQREVVIPNAPQPWVRKGNETATWVLNQLSLDALGLPYPGPNAYSPLSRVACPQRVLRFRRPGAPQRR